MYNQYDVNEAEGAAMNINFRQIILVLLGQLRAALMSKRVLIGYLIGVMAALRRRICMEGMRRIIQSKYLNHG